MKGASGLSGILDRASRKQKAPSKATTAIVALLTASLILVLGTTLAGMVQRKGDEMLAAQVFQQEAAQPREPDNQGSRRTARLFGQYLVALLDAMIRFEGIPKLDAASFLAIAASLPPEVGAQSIVLEHNAIVLTCKAEDLADYELLLQNLSSSQAFSEIRAGQARREEDGWLFTVACLPGTKEGQLELIEEKPRRTF